MSWELKWWEDPSVRRRLDEGELLPAPGETERTDPAIRAAGLLQACFDPVFGTPQYERYQEALAQTVEVTDDQLPADTFEGIMDEAYKYVAIMKRRPGLKTALLDLLARADKNAAHPRDTYQFPWQRGANNHYEADPVELDNVPTRVYFSRCRKKVACLLNDSLDRTMEGLPPTMDDVRRLYALACTLKYAEKKTSGGKAEKGLKRDATGGSPKGCGRGGARPGAGRPRKVVLYDEDDDREPDHPDDLI